MRSTESSRKRTKRSGHGQRYEIKVAGQWRPSLRKSQRPRVGGKCILMPGRPPTTAVIEAVRERA